MRDRIGTTRFLMCYNYRRREEAPFTGDHHGWILYRRKPSLYGLNFSPNLFRIMKWLLVMLVASAVSPNSLDTHHLGVYNSMNACFEAREAIVEIQGRPIVGYQVVCVAVP